MSGTLFVVATPIGNLEDITLRALRVLREAHVIAAEDTRRTAKLLAHYAIATPSLSFHAHNTRTRIPQLLARLTAGDQVALVTDAGTPGVSDPGSELINACWDHDVAVDPIPGAAAPLAAAVASGFPLEPLTVLGFAPARAKDRKPWLEQANKVKGTITFFEAPHRIHDTLADLGEFCGDRPILVAREMTKRHQEFIRAASSRAIGRLPEPKGEFTIVLGPSLEAKPASTLVPDELIYDDFCRMPPDISGGRRAAVAVLGKKYGRSTKDVYALVERLKKLGA